MRPEVPGPRAESAYSIATAQQVEPVQCICSDPAPNYLVRALEDAQDASADGHDRVPARLQSER